MPKINQMLLKLEGFKYITPLHFNMGYYHIRLRKTVSNLFKTILLWVNYCYKHLPMGIAISPEIFQQKMNYLFHGF